MTDPNLSRRSLLLAGLTATVIPTHSATASDASNGTGIRIDELRCEYAENPLGIETSHPRFSWVLVSSERRQKQIAYRIVVSEENLQTGAHVIWDTGKIASDSSIQVSYEGPELRSRGRYSWVVIVWDKDGKPVESQRAFWEMGLLSPDDWHAKWIGFPAGWGGRALYFRKQFGIAQRIRSARAYIAGLGYYEFRLNGSKIGDRVLDPGFTEYSKRVLYATYDITQAVRTGDNAIGVIVGNGWYGSPSLLAQIEIQLEDYSTQLVFTDHDINHGMAWDVTSGPIIANSIYDGERYDARLEKPGWDMPFLPEHPAPSRTEGWRTANGVSGPGGHVVSTTAEPIRVISSFHPKTRTSPAAGIFVFDTGQNLAGWAALSIQAERGTRITLKFAEVLRPDGFVNQANLKTAAATDEYICKGGGRETWEPRFTYHGFRYVQVEGYPGEPATTDITIRVVRSALETGGTFECTDPLLNQIQQMVWWTEASNLYSIPTDCPQRDERMGWLNDLTARLEESLYNFRAARFYSNFVDDIRDGQNEIGAIGDTAPFRWGTQPADPVCVSYLLLGWQLYLHYGDKRILDSHFAGFRKWVDYLFSQTDNYIVRYGYYGDWSPPARFGKPEGSPVSRETPNKFMSTGYLYYSCRLLSLIAGIIGKSDLADNYKRLAGNVAEAFQRAFWNPETGGYCSANQACNSFALFLGIVPAQYVNTVLDCLIRNIKAEGVHLTTGNLCTKYVLEVLSEHGQADLAFELASQRTYPSWGYMIANGATTLWERWENMTGGEMNSHNHPMLGSVSSWLYKYVAGIMPMVDSPGFKCVRIRPCMVQGLKSASAEYKTMYGVVRSSWKKDKGRIELNVTVPPNASAQIVLPVPRSAIVFESGRPLTAATGVRQIATSESETTILVDSGTYQFST